MRSYLVGLCSYDDTYYRTVVSTPLDIPNDLRDLAHAKGFRLDVTPLDSFAEMESFLNQLETR